ncbi:hypothetical protein [Candidatus Borrarchaeum sp.]|uniref:hypothetical protein n=1 Tax=Candidatus Borrarchaeum sp. TaxID=2846742 RepID=UPI00257BB0CC|nr:hypothetical protein [Candidatus Borrarchaeum sp.]
MPIDSWQEFIETIEGLLIGCGIDIIIVSFYIPEVRNDLNYKVLTPILIFLDFLVRFVRTFFIFLL